MMQVMSSGCSAAALAVRLHVLAASCTGDAGGLQDALAALVASLEQLLGHPDAAQALTPSMLQGLAAQLGNTGWCMAGQCTPLQPSGLHQTVKAPSVLALTIIIGAC